MFNLIQQVFIVLLSFSESLARVAVVSDKAKCLSLNEEPSLINLNLVEVKYYLLRIILNKCTVNCNVLPSNNMFSKRNKIHKY